MKSKVIGNISNLKDLEMLKQCFDNAIKIPEAEGGPQKKVGISGKWRYWVGAASLPKEHSTKIYLVSIKIILR